MVQFSAGSDFCFTISFRPTLGSHNPPVQCITGAFCVGVKRPEGEGAGYPWSNAKGKNRWSYKPTSASRHFFMASCIIMHLAFKKNLYIQTGKAIVMYISKILMKSHTHSLQTPKLSVYIFGFYEQTQGTLKMAVPSCSNCHFSNVFLIMLRLKNHTEMKGTEKRPYTDRQHRFTKDLSFFIRSLWFFAAFDQV
jgi:hypothetical protein